MRKDWATVAARYLTWTACYAVMQGVVFLLAFAFVIGQSFGERMLHPVLVIALSYAVNGLIFWLVIRKSPHRDWHFKTMMSASAACAVLFYYLLAGYFALAYFLFQLVFCSLLYLLCLHDERRRKAAGL